MTCGARIAMMHPAMSFTTRRLREEKPPRIAWKPTALLLLRLGGPLMLLATRMIQDRREERAEQRELTAQPRSVEPEDVTLSIHSQYLAEAGEAVEDSFTPHAVLS